MTLDFDLYLPRRDFDICLNGSFGNGITGIYGPSGSGKTTFFNLISGLEKPESGSVALNGRVLTDVEKGIFVAVHKRRVGMVFQDKLLFPHLTVKENLLFGTSYANDEKITYDEVVELLNLRLVVKSKPHMISGGEQQRTAIGRALLTSPELLLFDEPFNAVDYELRNTILPYIKELEDYLKIPILVISHDRDDLRQLTDKICFISRGRERAFGNMYKIASL